jgi:serine/threonine-protein kinase
MFADMVGYTALMQANEATARAQRDRYRAVLSSVVERHGGQILQYYGDGALCVFDSAVQAVHCSVKLQLELRRDPPIAARIGLHTGDIAYDSQGIYGDGVNVASRIETLAAPGGVMVSAKVYDEIKNHPSIQAVAFGAVYLKNVAHPTPVFAISNEGLSVPSSEDVQSKSEAGAAADPLAAGAIELPVGSGEAFLKHVREAALVQWSVVYLVAAVTSLGILQFLSRLNEWPPLILLAFQLALFIGFIGTLVVAWYHGKRGRQRVRRSEVAIIGALVLVTAFAISMLASEPGGPSEQPESRLLTVSDARPSVAVLPFANLSADEANAYFASGLHDEVLTQLQHVAGLRVISRSSVMEYAEDRPNVREIGRNLDVSYVVEATVQRMGERLRVNVQLIDARNDGQVWAERYDRELNDAFEVQSDIAQKIATELAATLSPEERGAIALAPTDNPEAYRFYLQGHDYAIRAGYSQQNFEAAEGLFQRALSLDPDFALAHAELSSLHGLIYWENVDPSANRLDAQRAEAEAALRLQPDLPQTHAALGWLHYVRGEFQEALQEYEIALEGLPNDADVIARVGYAHRRLGNWPGVFEAFEQARTLNPRNATLYYDLGGHSFAATCRYSDAVDAYQKALTLAPDLYDAAVQRGKTYIHWQGQLDTLRAVLAALPPASQDPVVDLARVELAFWDRDADRLLELLDVTPSQVFETQLDYMPKEIYAAWAHRLRGNEAAARASFEAARRILEPLTQERPDDERLVVSLGYVNAGLGRVADARSSAERAAQSRRRYAGPLPSPQALEAAARILAQVNLAEEAVQKLEGVLQGASPVSVRTLGLDPLYDPIRQHAAFQALLSRYSNKCAGR